MKQAEITNQEPKRYYLREFELYDGECMITFNIVEINFVKYEAKIAVTKEGKINVIDFDLLLDDNGDLYFEYGACYDKIAIDDFEEVE